MRGLPAEVIKIDVERKMRPAFRLVKSRDLFADNREVIIEHNEDFYRLSITKAGKLILNK